MTEQEQFEADYLAAFPKHGKSALALYGFGRNADEYEKQATRIALRVWQQQAARHKAEIDQFVKYVKYVRDAFDKELSAGYKTRDKEFAVELLSAGLKCLDWRQPSESCGGDAEYKRLCKLQDAAITKYEEKQ